MKRAGFTMIELIFVIVILGILAAVAVPKLAATRADAAASATIANWKTAIAQLQATATATGAVPADLRTLIDSSATLLVDATTIRAADDANATCSLATVSTAAGTTTLTISSTSTATPGCALFDSVTDGNITLTGSAVTR